MCIWQNVGRVLKLKETFINDFKMINMTENSRQKFCDAFSKLKDFAFAVLMD